MCHPAQQRLKLDPSHTKQVVFFITISYQMPFFQMFNAVRKSKQTKTGIFLTLEIFLILSRFNSSFRHTFINQEFYLFAYLCLLIGISYFSTSKGCIYF